MPRDGSGVHSLPSGYLAVTGDTIQPSQHNPPLEDLSAAITESIARTGVTSITADIPFGNNKITLLGDATDPADALNMQTADARYDARYGWIVVDEQAVSGSPSSMAFTGLTEAVDHRLEISGVRPATDDVSLILQVQTGGVTWQTSSYIFGGRQQGVGGGADTGSTVDSYTSGIILTRGNASQGVGNAAGEGADGEVCFNPADTNARRRFRSSVVYTRSDGSDCHVVVGGAYGSASAITGVRLVWGSGNFANVGSVTLLRRVS